MFSQLKAWNDKIADTFFSDQELNFRGYALYLLTLIFFVVTFIVMIYDFVLGYRFDALLEMVMCFGAAAIFTLNLKYRYNVWIAQIFFWFIALAAFAMVLYHHFDSTVLFLILTPIIAILILPASHVLFDFFLYEAIVALLFIYGYHYYAQENPTIFSQFALLNYITGTLYLFTFWYFYHVSIERAVEILSRLHNQKNLLLQELHHRVKNNFNLILSLLKMQSSHKNFHDTDEFIRIFSQRVESIVLAHELLFIHKQKGELDLAEYIPKLIGQLVANAPHIKAHLHITALTLPIDRLIYLGLLLNEMVTNTIKQSGNQPTTFTITLKENGQGCYELHYEDNLTFEGEKIEEGFGMRVMKLAAKQIGATLQIDIKRGVTYTLKFPCKELP